MMRPALFVLAVLLAVSSCTPRSDDLGRLTAVPGTEGLGFSQPSTPSFSISPSGSLVVFPVKEGLSWPDSVRFRIVDLESGATTESKLVSRDAMYSLETHCWIGESVVVDGGAWPPYWRSVWTPPDSSWSLQRPELDLTTCSDCQAWGPIREALKYLRTWRGTAETLSAMSVYVEEGATFVVVAGRLAVPGEFAQIIRYRLGKSGLESRKVLIDHRQFRFNTNIELVRVSPDHRYVAYTLNVKHRLPIPFPAGARELWVYDIRKQARCRIGQLQHTGNVMWSPDSQRVYIAGRDRYSAPGRVWVFDLNESH